MTGTEIDFVVQNSLEALALYQKIFDIEVLEATSYPVGMNEVVFTLHGTRFHMLDENPDYHLLAPSKEHSNTIWFNISVEDIERTHATALQQGCREIQGITTMMEGAIRNAMFVDPFGYVWMLHDIRETLSMEERTAMLEEMIDKK